MKLAIIVNPKFRLALTNLSNQSIPLPASFKLKGIIKKVDEEFAKYEECRMACINRLAKKDKKGKLILDARSNAIFEGDSIQSFNKEINDLNQLEVELDTLKISELGSKVEISAQDLIMLDTLIQE